MRVEELANEFLNDGKSYRAAVQTMTCFHDKLDVEREELWECLYLAVDEFLSKRDIVLSHTEKDELKRVLANDIRSILWDEEVD